MQGPRGQSSLTGQQPSEPVLDARDLEVVHRGRRTGFFDTPKPVQALNHVSIEVRRGEFVGLVGESGSGKTTLGFVAAGFLPPTSGKLLLNGEDLTTLRGHRLRAARSCCQMIFQDPYGSLDPRQTIASCLREIRALHPERTAWVTDPALMELVGLNPVVLHRYPHALSGGQAQRIAIARAILVQPALIIADEPTSALDVSVQAQIINLLIHLQQTQGVAVLLISHDLAVVRQTCERVYVLYRGQLVESGPAEDVLVNPQDDYTKRLIAAVLGKGGSLRPRDAVNARAAP